jgi:hypothetical protein
MSLSTDTVFVSLSVSLDLHMVRCLFVSINSWDRKGDDDLHGCGQRIFPLLFVSVSIVFWLGYIRSGEYLKGAHRKKTTDGQMKETGARQRTTWVLLSVNDPHWCFCCRCCCNCRSSVYHDNLGLGNMAVASGACVCGLLLLCKRRMKPLLQSLFLFSLSTSQGAVYN